MSTEDLIPSQGISSLSTHFDWDSNREVLHDPESSINYSNIIDSDHFDHSIFDINKSDSITDNGYFKICDIDDFRKEPNNLNLLKSSVNSRVKVFDDKNGDDSGSKINNGDLVVCSNEHDVKIGVLLPDSNSTNRKIFVFAEEVKITKFRCKLCSLMFDTVQLVQKHFFDSHLEDDCQTSEIVDTCSNENLTKSEQSKANMPSVNPAKANPGKKKASKRKNTKKRFPCDWPDCDYVARHSAHLRDHRCTHTGEKRFRCSWADCGLAFIQASALKLHMRTHTGERPYCCKWPNCSMIFSQSSNLRVHMRTHTGEKPFVCDWPGCESRFSVKGNLDDHKKLHLNIKRFVCDYPNCNSRFIHNSHLKKHKLIHRDVKPFACDWPDCNYRAVRKSDLTNHISTHTGEKKFTCTICQKSFTRQPQLKRHLSSAHSSNQYSQTSADEYLIGFLQQPLTNDDIL